MNYSLKAVALPTIKPVEVFYNISREMFLTLIQDKIYLIMQVASIVFITILPYELLMEAIVLWSNWFDTNTNDLVW
jgi:hypothetical protein